jgi:hypothetical protein
MHKLRLKAGQMTQYDRSRPLKDENGDPVPGRFHTKVIKIGESFDHAEDLAAKEPKRYERVGTAESNELTALRAKLAEAEAKLAVKAAPQALDNPAVFPGGQVSTGFQQGLPHGSGPLDPALAQRAGVKDADAAGSKEGSHADGGDGLEQMTVIELRECCKREGCPCPTNAHKADIIAALRAYRAE